jgi:hypothetical protein
MLNRRWIVALGCVASVIFATIVINLIGIHALGGVDGWTSWLGQHRIHFLAWRLSLYAATAYGWWWMRKRVLLRESNTSTHAHFHHVEAAAVVVAFALETTSWLQAP